MLEAEPDCLGIDSRTPLAQTLELAGNKKIAVQGNYEAASLFKSPDSVAIEVKNMLAALPSPSGYIANLGHGVLQRTPIESVQAMVNTVKQSNTIWQ